MWTGTLTTWTTELPEAKVTLRRFDDRFLGIFVNNKTTMLVTNLDESNVVVGTRVGTGSAADAGHVVDDDATVLRVAVNSAGRTANQADSIDTMHTGIGYHYIAELGTMADKTRIVIVGLGTGTHALIATGATVGVDEHSRSAVNNTMIDKKI